MSASTLLLLATALNGALTADDLIDAHDVRDLAVSDEGVLVATAGGVLVFDEAELADRWTTADGLQHQAVRALHVDPSGALWLAFDAGGCQRRLDGRFEACPEAASGARLTDFAGDSAGAVLGLAWDGQLVALAGVPAVVPVAPAPERAHRLVACAGTLWVGSRGGGLVALEADGSWRPLEGLRVVETLGCVGGELSAGGPEGLFRHEDGALVEIPLSGPRPSVSLVASAGAALVAVQGDGSVWWIEPDSTRLVDLPGPVAAAVETAGGLWLGGPAGLFRLAGGPGGTLEALDLPGPGSTDVSAVASDDPFGTAPRLALGMFRHGAALWRDGWQVIDETAGLPSDEVNGLAFDAAGNLWIATSGGLGRVDGSGRVTALVPPDLPCAHVNAVLPLSDADQVALATSCGVGVVDAAGAIVRWEARDQGLPHPAVYTLAVWDGRLVAGTNDGLAVRDEAAPERPWTSFRTGTSALADNWITAVAALPEGLAVGTYSGGLYAGTAPADLRRLEGPRYVNPNGLAALDGQLLVGGLSEGAYRADAQGLHDVPADCLPGADVTGFAPWQGGVLAATRSGAALLEGECLGQSRPATGR